MRLKKEKRNYQQRDKFFYAPPIIFPDWPYPSRYAIGMRFADFKAIGSAYFRFEVRGILYSIERGKALKLGEKYKIASGYLPNLIPLEEFEIIKKAEEPKDEKSSDPMPGRVHFERDLFGGDGVSRR